MKTQFTLLLIITVIVLSGNVIAQNSPEDIDLVTSSNIQKPEFPGGEKALQEYVQSTLDEELLNSVDETGVVFVKFTIDKQGRANDVSILEERTSVSNQKIREECQRVISEMPWWAPARDGDKPIQVKMSYSIKID